MARTGPGDMPRQNPCAQCGKPIATPDWVEAGEGRVSYLWHCRACDYRFEAIAIFDERPMDRIQPTRGLTSPPPYAAHAPAGCCAPATGSGRRKPVRLRGRAATARRHGRATIARAIDRPRPKPAASSMLRASSPRTNGSSMSLLARIRNAGAVVLDVDGERLVPTTRGGSSTSAPKRTAFSTRLVTQRCRSSGRAVAIA